MRVVKWVALGVLGVIFSYSAYIAVSIFRLPSVTRLADRSTNLTIQVKDWKGNNHPFVVGPNNGHWTPSQRIPDVMKWAVVVAEDARFYSHDGIDIKAIKNAVKYDLEKRRFARGASTITQQVAKNLFLTREKSLTRKLEEVILALWMERVLTKGRIMELYLNVVELGPMVYGVGHAAPYYFGKTADDLSPRECAFLAAMLPGPKATYNPYRHLSRVLKRSDMILRLMRDNRVITNEEYRQALAETPNIGGMQKKVDDTFAGRVQTFFRSIFRGFR
ncbi:MAG TPA: biosynthetic peptidoglycan transglycosylase [Geobacteraceae bacterium]